MKASDVLTEVLDYFARTGCNPGDWWAPTDDGSELCLEFNGNDGAKFWLDLSKDGTIQLLWKDGSTKTHCSLTFRAAGEGS